MKETVATKHYPITYSCPLCPLVKRAGPTPGSLHGTLANLEEMLLRVSYAEIGYLGGRDGLPRNPMIGMQRKD